MNKTGPESKFRKKICDELKKCNALVFPIINGVQQVDDRIFGGQIKGMSDTLVVHRYIGIVFLEFKAANGKVSEVQKRFLNDVNDRVPYSGFVVREPNNLIYMDGTSDMFFGFEDGKDLIKLIQELRKGGYV